MFCWLDACFFTPLPSLDIHFASVIHPSATDERNENAWRFKFGMGMTTKDLWVYLLAREKQNPFILSLKTYCVGTWIVLCITETWGKAAIYPLIVLTIKNCGPMRKGINGVLHWTHDFRVMGMLHGTFPTAMTWWLHPTWQINFSRHILNSLSCSIARGAQHTVWEAQL